MSGTTRTRRLRLLVLLGLLLLGAVLGGLGVLEALKLDRGLDRGPQDPEPGRAEDGSPRLGGLPREARQVELAETAASDAAPERLRIRVVDAEGRPAREMAVSFQTGAWREGPEGGRRFVRKEVPGPPSRERVTKDGVLTLLTAWVDEVLEIWAVDPIEDTEARKRGLVWPHESLLFDDLQSEIVLHVNTGRVLRIHLQSADGEPLDPWFPSGEHRGHMKCDVCVPDQGGELVVTSVARPSDPVPDTLAHLGTGLISGRDVVLRLYGHDRAFRPVLEVPVPDGAEDVRIEIPRSRRLSVRLEDPNGRPVYGTVLLHGTWRGKVWRDRAWAEDGRAEIAGLPTTESVFVGVAPSSFIDRPWGVPDPVRVPPETSSLTIPLLRGMPVKLFIVGPRGDRIRRASVGIQRWDGHDWVPHGSVGRGPQDRGALVIPGLRPGRYRLTAAPQASYTLAKSGPLEFEVPCDPLTVVCPAVK